MLGLGDAHRLKGKPFQATFVGNSAGTNALTLRLLGDNATAVVVDQVKERLVITDYFLSHAVGGECAIYADDNNTASVYMIARGTLAANGQLQGQLNIPVFGRQGISLNSGAPTIDIPAGQCTCIVRGIIVKNGR